MPDCDIGERVCNILTIVSRYLEMFVDVLELDDRNRICRFEKVGYCMGKYIIREIFQPVHFYAPLFDVMGILGVPLVLVHP